MDATTKAVLKNAPKTLSHVRALRVVARRIESDVTRIVRIAKAMPNTAAPLVSTTELRDQVRRLCGTKGPSFADLVEATGATEPRLRFAINTLRDAGLLRTEGNLRHMRYFAVAKGKP